MLKLKINDKKKQHDAYSIYQQYKIMYQRNTTTIQGLGKIHSMYVVTHNKTTFTKYNNDIQLLTTIEDKQ